jgi:uncharacterized protein YabE (DUF348 family)
MYRYKSRSKRDSAGTKIRRLSKHPFIIPVTTFMVLFFMVVIGFIGFSGTTFGASDTRVVSLSIDGQEQVVPTRATSVADLLNRLDIKVGDKDIVSPGLDTPIEEDGFSVDVYRARPVLVSDGSTKTVTYTAEPTPVGVAKSVGLTIYPEDDVTKTPAEANAADALNDGVVAEQIIIDRATPVTLNLYGTPVTLRTRATTVQGLLDEKDIKLNDGDNLKPESTTPITADMQVFVLTVGKEIVQVEESIEQTVTYVDDYNLTANTTQVKEAGQPGKKLVTYEIQEENGIEVTRRIIQQVVTAQPVAKVIARGRKAPVVVGDKASIMTAAGIPAGQHYAADFIISHESGWRVNALNSRGCGGLGQACPSSKLAAACPNWQSDAVCQMRFFNGYAVGRYGSWTRAMEIWQTQRWW